MTKDMTEKQFLSEYDVTEFKRPSTSVDMAIFTVFENELYVLTVKRSNHPEKGKWALVGGFVDVDKDKDIEATAKRKLVEKTGVKTPYLEQYKTIGNKKRDPRSWSITTVYFALIPSDNIKLKAGVGSSDIKWSKVANEIVEDKLAFDHAELLAGCMERLRNKVLYTSLPIHLLSSEFTLGELQKVYEIILGQAVERKSFRRRILNANIIEETGKMKQSGRRPAKVYQLKDEDKTHFFVRNIEGAS